jgi:hypothetical protein
MSDTDERKLADLPPSAKLVFGVLEHEGALTQKRLVEETRLSVRTVRYALGRLKDINAVNEQISFMDARQMLYTPHFAPSRSFRSDFQRYGCSDGIFLTKIIRDILLDYNATNR